MYNCSYLMSSEGFSMCFSKVKVFLMGPCSCLLFKMCSV